MITHGEWRKIKSICFNCDGPLESRPLHSSFYSFYIDGGKPMEYRHYLHSDCKEAKPYSGWNQYEEWKKGLDYK